MGESPANRTCPHCGAANRASLLVTLCASCGEPLDAPSPKAGATPPAAPAAVTPPRAPARPAAAPRPQRSPPTLSQPLVAGEGPPRGASAGLPAGCRIVGAAFLAFVLLWIGLALASSLAGRRRAPVPPRSSLPTPPRLVPPRPPAGLPPDQVRPGNLDQPLLTHSLFEDNFGTTPAGGKLPSRWQATVGQWKVENGALSATSPHRAICWATGTPVSDALEAEATVVFRQHLKDEQWGVAGVVLGESKEEFWYVGLVEGPRGEHYPELVEQHKGRWNAQSGPPTALQALPGGLAWFNWTSGRPYRLFLSLQPDRVRAEVRESGRVVFRQGFALPAGPDAVRQGRLGLMVGGASAVFDDVRVAGAGEGKR